MKFLRNGLVIGFLSITSATANTDTPTKTTDLSKEAPNILYVVPWSETPRKKTKDPKLVLHNLIGDLYEPQVPSDW